MKILLLAAAVTCLAQQVTVIHYDREVCASFPLGCAQGVVVFITAPRPAVSAYRIELSYVDSSGNPRQTVTFADRSANQYDTTVVSWALDDISGVRLVITPLIPEPTVRAQPQRKRS